MVDIFNQSPVYELREHGIITHPGVEESWSIEKFKENLRVFISNLSETLEFDLINIDCSFANAIRRILIAEVPSVSIERVYLQQNTSIMPDEVLCHRLGLIPLTVDPKLLGFPSKPLPASDELSDFNPAEHLIFDLKVCFNKNCTKPIAGRSGKDPSSEMNIPSVRSLSIYSSELQWVPLPGQENLKEGDAPSVVSQTILVNKLAVGDELEARCVAVKGIGRDHAKFSPVSAAYYKFMPIIKLLRPIEGDEARLLQSSFAPGVIGIDPQTEQAYVNNPRLDNGSREHLRHLEFRKDSVFVGTCPTHCVFTVESISPTHRPPARLVRSAIEVMINKCKHYLAITKKPGFGDISAENLDTKGELSGKAQTSHSNTESVRSQLNGREVGLEVAHTSPDKRRITYTFHGEDHTLGLALRFCILHSTHATFCGYCVPHPLEDKIHLDVQVRSGSANEVLREGLQCLHDCFVHLKSAFKEALVEYNNRRTEIK
ncbi:hypothetical protein P879_08678 [Paragonimus westermani]|uniref:DNA-directed RNA polymerase RpoA/D/Rpb3-type domain-containing protein n=1 Tax=Paragonimus westermani TaxID=34504 RepID=A0A8T0D3W8_9TREM|nr:hypothetical protein P879_08678 [Paragonimus westermani]